MTCPHCAYKHGWDVKTDSDIAGEKGDFFSLPVKMEKQLFMDDDYERLYACPKCGVAFIDV